jgi:hypothetical protein
MLSCDGSVKSNAGDRTIEPLMPFSFPPSTHTLADLNHRFHQRSVHAANSASVPP